MNFDTALERALDGNAVLFLGAGFSLGATNSRGEPFELASKFANRLASMIDVSIPAELQDVAEEFRRVRGEAALMHEVIKSFRATVVQKHHSAIAAVPWTRVYTTNYDNVFELAAGNAARVFRPVTVSERPGDFRQDEPICVHLNGYVERLTSSIGDELKLTDASYITSSVESSVWAETFRLDLTMAKAVFFVGYSLGDLDIARLIAATDSLQEKSFFVVGPNPSARTENRAARYGIMERFDAAWFGRQLTNKRGRYNAPERSHPVWYCLEPYAPNLRDTTAVSDRAVFDLLFRGYLDRQLAWNSLRSTGSTYLLHRNCVDRILEILNNPSNIVIAHGNLGNGKSMVAEAVASLATAAGRTTYSLTKRSPSMQEELSAVCSSASPFVLIIDSYPAWMDALDFLGNHKNENMCLFLTARTAPNDILADRIAEIFNKRLIHEIDVDRMSDDELTSIDGVFEQYGLWGAKTALQPRARVQYLRFRCRAEWQSILIDLFQSPDIQARLDRVLTTLDRKSGYYDILLGILALTVLSQRVTMNTLTDIFGHRVLDVGFQRDIQVSEFIDSGLVKSRAVRPSPPSSF